MPTGIAGSELTCDGCGRPATPEHIQERLARLECATRFRPIHISALFLISSPPRLDADFYHPAGDAVGTRPLDALFGALGIVAGEGEGAAAGREGLLAEFQRQGFFVAAVCECPLTTAETPGAIEGLASTIAKRIRFSYKPKAVLLLSSSLKDLEAPLAAAVRGIHVLNASGAFESAARGDAAGAAKFLSVVSRALQA
ncbi:MAG: hypothetical protein ACLP1Y_11765 [Candidatus Acidiferrales bacterium]